MIRFEIPYPPTKRGKSAWNRRFGLNAYYVWKHYMARKRDAKDLHNVTMAAMHKAKIKREPVNGPVEVRFYWDDNLDIDNHAVIGKAVVDVLKGQILPDDNRKWVRKVSHEFWTGGCIRVEVCPYEN